MISAEIIADSICNDIRITTFRLKYPRFIHSEIMTHRVFSRNSASSRAVPCKKLRSMVLKNPVIPIHFGRTQKGMQANKELTGLNLKLVYFLWLTARYPACFIHWCFEKLKLHKQIANRIIEPWMWIEVVLTGTEFNNFFLLRDHKDAEPHFQCLARLMRTQYRLSKPKVLRVGEWHLPFIRQEDIDLYELETLKQISTARCGRVSYYLFEGGYSNPESDKEICKKMFGSFPRHLSASEHLAQAIGRPERYGNFTGWKQYRKEIQGESGGDYEFIKYNSSIS